MSKASKNTSHRKLFTVSSDAPFQFVEAYKSLRTNLEFLSSAGNCKTILITSSVPEEGKTNVAVNLAMTIAASGKRVVLVDCDLRKATISRYLRIPRNHAGLTNVITSASAVLFLLRSRHHGPDRRYDPAEPHRAALHPYDREDFRFPAEGI